MPVVATEDRGAVRHVILQCPESGPFCARPLWATRCCGPTQIRTDDVVRWPYAGATRSLIHERDIADVAVRALTDDALVGGRPILSGPEALTQAEQVETIGEAIGRPLSFEEVSPAAARPELVEDLRRCLFRRHVAGLWAAMVDEPEVVTSTVPEITGTPARSLRQWALDHAEDFRPTTNRSRREER